MLELQGGGPVVDSGGAVSVGSDDGDGQDPVGCSVLLLVEGSGEVEAPSGFYFHVDSEDAEDVGALPACAGGFGVDPSGFAERFGDDAL